MADNYTALKSSQKKRYISKETFNSLDLSQIPVGSEYEVVSPIEKGDLSADINNALNKAEKSISEPTNQTTGSDGDVLVKKGGSSEWKSVSVPSVVQSTGQSTTDVMSQKAVTDTFATKGEIPTVINYSAGNHVTIGSDHKINAVWPTASDSGYAGINKTGTITGITMNGVSKGTSGIVDLGTVITSVDLYASVNEGQAGNVAGSNPYLILKKNNEYSNIQLVGGGGTSVLAGPDGKIFINGGITESSVTTTGSGNAITSATVSNSVITFNKDTTFLTSHQSLADCAKLSGGNTFDGVQKFNDKVNIISSDGLYVGGPTQVYDLSITTAKIKYPFTDSIIYEYSLPKESGTFALTSDVKTYYKHNLIISQGTTESNRASIYCQIISTNSTKITNLSMLQNILSTRDFIPAAGTCYAWSDTDTITVSGINRDGAIAHAMRGKYSDKLDYEVSWISINNRKAITWNDDVTAL